MTAKAGDDINKAIFRRYSSKRRSKFSKDKNRSSIHWDEANLENNNNVSQHSNSLEP